MTRSTPTLTTPLPVDSNRYPAIPAGEDLLAGDICAVRSDGKAWKTDGTSGTGVLATTGQVDGVALKDYRAGMVVSLYHDVDLAYATGLTPGTFVFPSGTVKGGVATVAATLQVNPCGRVLPADSPDLRQRIRFFRTYATLS